MEASRSGSGLSRADVAKALLGTLEDPGTIRHASGVTGFQGAARVASEGKVTEREYGACRPAAFPTPRGPLHDPDRDSHAARACVTV